MRNLAFWIGQNWFFCFPGAGWGAQIGCGSCRITSTETYGKHGKCGGKHAERIMIFPRLRQCFLICLLNETISDKKVGTTSDGEGCATFCALYTVQLCAESSSTLCLLTYQPTLLRKHWSPQWIRSRRSFFLFIKRIKATPLTNLSSASFSV